MSLINPLPFWLVFLSPLLVTGYLFAWRISKLIFIDRLNAFVFSFSLFLALWLILIIYPALLTHSYINGLTMGTVALFVLWAAYELYLSQKKNKGTIEIKNKISSDKWMWVTAFLSSLVVYLISSNGYFHDELLINGHQSLIAQFQNDFFPPRNLLNPNDGLRYHFGFSLLCANITAFTRCGVDFAIDIVTSISWFYCWIALWAIGKKLFAYKYAGGCVAFITLFGGGLAPLFGIFCTDAAPEVRLLGLCGSQIDYYFNVPLLSYFFQHPYAAGLPLTLGILLIVFENKFINPVLNNIVLGLVFIALYFCQTVLFITLLPVLVLFYLRYEKNYLFILVSIVVLLIVYLSKAGLLFMPLEEKSNVAIGFRFWPRHQPLHGIIKYYAGSVGLLIIFGFIGFRLLKLKFKPLLGYLSVLALGMPFFFAYEYTSDIQKFITVSCLYLGILSGGAIAWLCMAKSLLLRWVSYAGVFLLTICGFAHAGVMIYEEFVYDPEIHERNIATEYYYYTPLTLSSDYVDAANWLRNNVRKNETVYVNRLDKALSFAVNSGLPTVYDELFPRAKAFGLPEKKRKMFADIFSKNYIASDELKYLNVRWIIQEESDTLSVQPGEYSNYFRVVNRFNKLKILQFNRP